MEDEQNPNVIGKLVEHPDISYQVVITQKIDGELEICLLDHVSKTSANKTENEYPSEFVYVCRKLIENAKIAHRNAVLFDK